VRLLEFVVNLKLNNKGDKMNSYAVTFVADYFCLRMTVEANDEEMAITRASEIMESTYGWDIMAVSTVDIEVEEF
jgi:hypothetical protein